jgi:predicted lipoprotein with Yx(FWY)xxD motif
MKNHLFSAAGAVAIGLLAAACSSSGGTAAPSPSGTHSASPSAPASSVTAPTKFPVKDKDGNAVAVALRKIDGLPVPTLTDGFGRAIYMFDKDANGKSMCNDPCDRKWQVIAVFGDSPVAGGGAKQALLGTIKRSNGVIQATYNGHPLYYYTGNGKTTEGDTSTANGQGVRDFGAKWWVLDVIGNKVTTTG